MGRNKKGFTLVETIIYISLMSIPLSNIIMFGTNISSIRKKNHDYQQYSRKQQIDDQFDKEHCQAFG